jgi:2-polyprenyl-3-methyl-5-hydroxy-6-metoxy-1,4-benzoquinol methylase
MPSSNLLVAPTVLNLIHQVHKPGGKILDVGPGWGKYATLIREYVDPKAKITGIELWKPYIVNHRLTHLYDPIIHGDVRTADPSWLSQFPIVLLADVIEHMTLNEGNALLERLPGWVIVSTPRDFFHNPKSCPPPEKHLSHWTAQAFQAMPRFDYLDSAMLKELGGIVARLKPLVSA